MGQIVVIASLELLGEPIIYLFRLWPDRNAFSTYNETSAMVRERTAIGMAMKTAYRGQAENEVLRCDRSRIGTPSRKWLKRGT